MANAIFTTKRLPSYDDLPEERYHFPKRYLRAALQTVGDWIIYYEPRREDSSPNGTAGKSAYFAAARVNQITEDTQKSGHFYAWLSEYIEFPVSVSFKHQSFYLESSLMKSDGSTNKGAFRISVRLLPRHEYDLIIKLGFPQESLPLEHSSTVQAVADDVAEYNVLRNRILTERSARDIAFSRSIQNIYQSTCAFTGLQIINGGGRCEIEAAHIRPVADGGPDSSRNGIALSRTIHWMFDRGLVSLTDEGEILASKKHLPEPILRILNPSKRAILPADPAQRPHQVFLRHHREAVCQGKQLELIA